MKNCFINKFFIFVMTLTPKMNKAIRRNQI